MKCQRPVLERKVERFQSGREYVKMKENHDDALRERGLLIMFVLMREKGENIFARVSEIFG